MKQKDLGKMVQVSPIIPLLTKDTTNNNNKQNVLTLANMYYKRPQIHKKRKRKRKKPI